MPALIPLTTPVALFTDALPPDAAHVVAPALARAVVAPGHTLMVPVIAPGNGLTTTFCVAIQPVGRV